jgi:peptide-methionine (S)-S-oxide reductase
MIDKPFLTGECVRHFNLGGVMMILSLMSFFGAGCSRREESKAKPPEPQPVANKIAADKGQVAIFAGGCFWCVEGSFRQLDGVIEAVSGYAGGTKQTANYDAVCSGTTGHAEAVRVKYDPAKISYGDLLRVFYSLHDPTTLNRQGGDVGTQYRSAIFYLDEDQKAVAQAYIDQLNKAKLFSGPVVTSLEPITLAEFYPAEDYHQNYVACHLRDSGYVQFHALPIVQKVREDFKDKLKPGSQDPS